MAKAKLRGRTMGQLHEELEGTLVGKLDTRVGGPLMRARICSNEEFLGLTRDEILNHIRGFKSKQQALEEINRVRMEYGVNPI